MDYIEVHGAREHNLKDVNVKFPRGAITVVTGVSGSGKSSLAFDTVLRESQRRFFYTLSMYTRQFLDMGSRPKVKRVSGLSPAIALTQRETKPSRKATVGSQSDLNELFGVMFARFGTRHCPEHGLETSGLDINQVTKVITDRFLGENLVIVAPIAKEKKGHFKTQLAKLAKKGFTKVYIDGDIYSLEDPPELEKEVKHTIKLIVDVVVVKETRLGRLKRSLDTSLRHGGGVGEYGLCERSGMFAEDDLSSFSMRTGCPSCGFSWPELDARYFSPNSLGRCPECDGYGELEDETNPYNGKLDQMDRACQLCEGTGLRRDIDHISLRGLTPSQIHKSTVAELKATVKKTFGSSSTDNPAMKRVLEQIDYKLDCLSRVGLSYLSLQRRVLSLSGGEAQRLRLSGILGENLTGILYVLDEPSQGLHPSEIHSLWEILEELKRQGNTIIVVDHDYDIIRMADWLIDLGPGGGQDGGQIMAQFSPDQSPKFIEYSKTAAYLSDLKKRSRSDDRGQNLEEKKHPFLTLKKPRLHNLKMDRIRLPLHAMTAITGVSGAGKSSLILGVLFENMLAAMEPAPKWRYCDGLEGFQAIDRVWLIDRTPIAKSSVSMPATYLDVFTAIRAVFAKMPEAQIQGITAKHLSLFSKGGRCEECDGKGYIQMSMRFLPDARIECPICEGRRYQSQIEELRFQGYSLPDVLSLTMAECFELFKNHPQIHKRLEPAVSLGLGYLRMGQPSASLSGGESQRLKLASCLCGNFSKASLLVLDEPTAGLHFGDIELLMTQLERIRQTGATIVILEHAEQVIERADWVLEIGPGAADDGGKLSFEGDSKAYFGRI